jgi:hypothetical protein
LRKLRKIFAKPIDVILIDEKNFYENLKPGTVISGLIIGYKKIYDEIKIEKLINELAMEIAEIDYEIYKGKRKIDLSSISKVKMKIEKARNRKFFI